MTRPAATLHTGNLSLPGTPHGAVVSAAAGPRLRMDAGRLLRDTAPHARRPGRARSSIAAGARLAVRVLELVVLGVVAGLYLMLAVVAPLAYEAGL